MSGSPWRVLFPDNERRSIHYPLHISAVKLFKYLIAINRMNVITRNQSHIFIYSKCPLISLCIFPHVNTLINMGKSGSACFVQIFLFILLLYILDIL